MSTTSTFRVEIGAWVESDTPKASGKGMRKVWVAPTPKGESPRLSVIRAGERGDVHVLTLHVGTDEQASDALEALSLALDALGALPAFTAPVPAKAPTPITRKAPTPPAQPAADKRAAAVAQARASKPAVTRNPAPAKAAPVAVEDELDAWLASFPPLA